MFFARLSSVGIEGTENVSNVECDRDAISLGLEFRTGITNEIVNPISDRATIGDEVCLKFAFHRYNPVSK